MRVACLDLPAFPLQLMWQREPALRDAPLVVIDDDRPQGEVQWACERARAAGVLIGQRYAFALSLCAGLRARVVPAAQVAEALTELRAALHRLSPRVEPGEPGTFWLDGDGLERVFPDGGRPSGRAWGLAIAGAMGARAYRGAVVVGFSRFATYAIARATRIGVVVLASDADERARASEVVLARLDVDLKLREALARLGVTKLGELVRLPGGGILERFGHDAHRLYQLAAGERWDPLVPVAPPEAPDERVVLDDDEDDLERLVFATKPPIDRLLDRLAARGRAVTALHVELTLKHAVGHVSVRAECVKPAAPTLDGRALLGLVHLRLTGMPPVAPVNAVRVWADDVVATREQLALFTQKPRRDLRAADEAIARLRAELGDDAVVRPALRDGHLPEASFAWERLDRVVAARPAPRSTDDPAADHRVVRPLIRRMFTRPQPLVGAAALGLPASARLERDDGWLRASLEHGAVIRARGPYVISGGWWAHEVCREYHFAELRRGDLLWTFYDRNRRRWFWHGAVQ